MQYASTIGLDIAKSVFQVHGINDEGNNVIGKRLSRSKVLAFFADLPPCLAFEVCAASWFVETQGP